MREFEVDRREERKAALRYRLQGKERPPAVDVYQELLGMDVKLQARVSKAHYRMQVRYPSGSKTELENAARDYWLNTLVSYIEEADLPLVRVAKETSDPAEVMRRAFGTRRMKTLRSRARAWSKVREWMIMFCGDPFPRDMSYMLEYLLFLVQEGVPKGRIQDVAASLAVLEDVGQVAPDMKISGMVAWIQGVRSRTAELDSGKTATRRAPPPSVAMLISLEINVVSLEKPEYERALSWVVLLCTWGCLRISDLEGLDPQRLLLGSRGLRGVLTRTKTTGPDKQVRETPIFVSRRISLTGYDWLKAGYDLWEAFGHKNRDYFVFCAGANLEKPQFKYASVEKVAMYIRQIFLQLGAVVKPRFQAWRHKDETCMLDPVGMLYWTGHSMRHFLPTVAAAVDIGKEQRDYVGRWHVNLHQSAQYVHTSRQIVQKVQEAVNRSIVEGEPPYDESELMEDYGCFLLTKGRMPGDWVKHHAVWKKVDEKLQIGGKWPTLDAEVIVHEIWGENLPQETAEEPQGHIEEETAVEEDPTSSSFYVTISRHSGFRRLHKVGCCGTQPWACHKVEYLMKVTSGVADAVCKTCKRNAGGAMEEDAEEDSSSSGSSSSTEIEEEDLQVPVDANERLLSEAAT